MFIETPRFPDCISFGAVGGMGFRTDVVTMASGHEHRNRSMEKALGRWEVGHNVMDPDEYEQLRAFFLLCAGQWAGFRFKDHTDYTVTGSDGVWVSLGGTSWQMYKRYSVGANDYLRKIDKPVSGTVVATVSGAAGTINYTTGQMSGGAGTPTRWTGEFDVPCRFGTDEMTAETITKRASDKQLLIGWRAIAIREIRL